MKQRYTCCLCGVTASEHELPVLSFPELAGTPAICARCIFEKLTGERIDWSSLVRRFRHPHISGSQHCEHCSELMSEHGWIDTLEGGHIVCPGDWIITGVQGEYYPCKPDIFRATYEPVDDKPFDPIEV